VDAARRNLSNNRKPANEGRRFWDLSAGILRCATCGRAMSPRTAGKRYFYYACGAGPTRYQEMAAAGLVDFDELRERLAGLDEARGDLERTLGAARRRADQLGRLERDRAALMREYAGAVPEALSDLPPEERRVYRMMRLEAALAPNGDIEMRGDVAPVSKNGTAYRPGCRRRR
jgi:multidrug efflux pump subunit AcrA (membrane-fusion protein)